MLLGSQQVVLSLSALLLQGGLEALDFCRRARVGSLLLASLNLRLLDAYGKVLDVASESSNPAFGFGELFAVGVGLRNWGDCGALVAAIRECSVWVAHFWMKWMTRSVFSSTDAEVMATCSRRAL